MSDGLTHQPPPAGPAVAPPFRPPLARAPRPSVRSVATEAVAVVVAFAVVGAVAGVVWWWVWSPPRGTVVQRGWYPDETGLRGEFRGTGLFIVVALVAALVLGALCAYVCDRAELVTLVAVLVGAVLAAWLMKQVGQHLGPPDPDTLARTTRRTTLDGDLRVDGVAPLLIWPIASLFALTWVYLLTTNRRQCRAQRAALRSPDHTPAQIQAQTQSPPWTQTSGADPAH